MSTTKLEFIRQKVTELATSPAWQGQVEFLTSKDLSLDEAASQKELYPGVYSEEKVFIRARNRFVRDWIKSNFLPDLESELDSFPGEEKISIQLIVHNDPASSTQLQTKTVKKVEVAKEPVKAPLVIHETLKPRYSFENFVIGTSNQFSHAAAFATAKLPGRNYNPLFIYGGVGLGKTHLLHAIGLEILKNNPQSRIICMSSERFINELIYCIRYEKMSDFRKKYRDSCDVLLIDDIQFIAGKERTQDEFFHTFNHLHDLQKQIVLTSDRTPREIPELEERLKSRFEWGLIADIQAPDLETRVAILKSKAEHDRVALTDDVALFLATHIKSNVRELEGALIRLNAFASLSNISISVSLAKDILKNVLGGIDRVLTIEHIQKVVADFYRLKIVDLIGKRRHKSLALPRQIAMYLCRKLVKTSFPEIGNKFGGKDHSTVVHAFGKIQGTLDQDPTLREQVLALENTLTRV